MQMKQHNLWHSVDVTNLSAENNEAEDVAHYAETRGDHRGHARDPEHEALWKYNCSRRMMWWQSAHHVQLLVILLETFRWGIVHCHEIFFSIQFVVVNYIRARASIFILQCIVCNNLNFWKYSLGALNSYLIFGLIFG